jgi:tripartite-type tricarboxylate transporter receptor subunit TctC
MSDSTAIDRNRRALLCAAGWSALLPNVLRAAEPAWPAKPVKIIVGFAPGGGSDFIARLLAQKLTMRLGSPVIGDVPGSGQK